MLFGCGLAAALGSGLRKLSRRVEAGACQQSIQQFAFRSTISYWRNTRIIPTSRLHGSFLLLLQNKTTEHFVTLPNWNVHYMRLCVTRLFIETGNNSVFNVE